MQAVAGTDYTVPTGEYIEEWLEDHGMTQTELAARAGVSRKHLNRVIAGAPVTPPLAENLELATGVPARRWLALEATYRADIERLRHLEQLAARRELADRVSRLATSLRKLGYLSAEATRRRPGQMLLEIMAFFRVSQADILESRLMRPAVAFKQSAAHEIDWPSVCGWLRLGELEAEDLALRAPPYDESSLYDSLATLRRFSRDSREGLDKAALELRRSGVVLTFVPELIGSRCYGATQWIGGRPVVQLSARGKNDAWIWFTMFHEIGHALLHPGDTIVDDGTRDSAEEEADAFANAALIPEEFVPAVRAAGSRAQVERVAETIGVSPGVVVGRIHHDQIRPHSWWRDLYAWYQFDDD